MRVMPATVDAIYDLLIAAEGILDGAQLRLYTNTIAEDDVEVAADLIIPTYTTYADVEMTGASVNVDSNGRPYIQWAAVEFVPTGIPSPNPTIKGAAILDEADVLVAVSNFPAPINLSQVSQVLTVLPKLRLGEKSQPEIVAVIE